MSKTTVMIARISFLATIVSSGKFHLCCMVVLTLLMSPVVSNPRHVMLVIHAVLIWRVATLQFGYRSRDPVTQIRAADKILDTAGMLGAALVHSTVLVLAETLLGW